MGCCISVNLQLKVRFSIDQKHSNTILEWQFVHRGNGAFPKVAPNRWGRGCRQECSSSSWRLRQWVGAGRVFKVDDPKLKPTGIPLASVPRRESRGVLSTGSGRRGPRADISDISTFHVKDVMDMDRDELMQKYNRTLRAVGLLRYMLQANQRVTEEPEQKM